MQLFNGKSKLFGVLLVLAAFFSFYLGDITTLTPPQKATAGVALVILVLLAPYLLPLDLRKRRRI